MRSSNDIVVVAMTREEAEELFLRCLRSSEEDTPCGMSVLNKLARILEYRTYFEPKSA